MDRNAAKKHVFKNLAERVRITVEWDGYQTGTPDQAWEVAVDTGTHTTAQRLFERAEPLKDGGVVEEKYKELVEGCKQLQTELDKFAESIVAKATFMQENVEKISGNYFDVAAKKFENAKKQTCVLTAPEPWFP